MLTYHKTTEEEKYRITAWKYDGDYAVYNSTPYAQQKRTGFGFANPKNHFYSFYDGADLIAGALRQGLRAADDADRVQHLPESVSGKAHVS